ncbi:hypothetical protein ACOSP7_000774 [Xanthoceras sorbifolium]
MATQQQPARPWFRLASLAGRPPPQATPTAEPQAPQPRPPVISLPAFRPVAQTQPQEPGQQPPPPGTGVSSVPTSPIRRTSVPTSPDQKTSPTSTVLPATTSPPKPQVSAPSASLPTSPIRKPTPYTASLPTSPVKPAPYTASSVTTSPVKPAPYTASVTTSPPKPARTILSAPTYPTNGATVTAKNREPSPKQSPRTIRPAVQTPVQSPKQTPTAPPPSPLTLPPPQLQSKAELEPKIPTEAEPKGVLVQKTIEKPKSWLHGTEPRKDFEETHHRPSIAHHHGKHEVPKDGEAKKKFHHQKKFSSDSEDVGMRIITIAGENKGASMEVIKSPLKGNSHTLHKNGNTKTESDVTGWHSSSSSSNSGEEGKPNMKNKNHNGKTMGSPHMGAFTNSNVQGVNNSIVFNSSCSHHDPGVHLSFSRKPSGHGFHIKDNGHGHQS